MNVFFNFSMVMDAAQKRYPKAFWSVRIIQKSIALAFALSQGSGFWEVSFFYSVAFFTMYASTYEMWREIVIEN